MRPSLSEGDTIAVVAPGFAVRAGALRAGVAKLRSMRFEVRVGEHVLSRHGYLAGTDAERARDLNRAARDRKVRGIWFARGGYGTARLLDLLDWKELIEGPARVFVGYSDATALFSPILRHRGSACLYGPVVSELGDEMAYHAGSLRSHLRGEPSTLRFSPAQVIRPGRARGRLLGGNLTVLTHLLDTPHAPDLRGAVVFLEDVGEEVYRLDRMLQHLKMAGALDEVTGIVLGSFRPPPRKRSFPPDRPLLHVLREALGGLAVPVVRGLPVGHLSRKRTLPLGAVGILDTRAGTLEVVGET